ncbi:hypothetical protein [Yersinia ruckeri]|uniref:hypothetical protein n=1 Tax=Yersinia ruckeri TaxID=29486 RepID=UPI0020C03946|nr:hypothetical protein [Yersinia ruckeri]MCK8586370.1 hypothetical protein [Yersinia ruckeri]MCW6615613.1 hypothetical protein [Yersinia ruckeri]
MTNNRVVKILPPAFAELTERHRQEQQKLIASHAAELRHQLERQELEVLELVLQLQPADIVDTVCAVMERELDSWMDSDDPIDHDDSRWHRRFLGKLHERIKDKRHG